MSCRIIAAAKDVELRLLFEAESHSRNTAGSSPVPVELPDAQVVELHGRIVELEQNLQRDVLHARDAAYREGESAGREKAAAELHSTLERLARSVAEVSGARSRFRREAEQDLVQLSLGIARRILRRELTIDPEAVCGLVRAALDKMQTRDSCRIRIHPDHHAAVRRMLDKQSTGAAEVVPDSALQPGDVVIESKRGDLDATIEGQLGEIERGFADRLKRWGE